MKKISLSLFAIASIYAQTIEIEKSGWSLLGATENIDLTKIEIDCVDSIYKYSKKWFEYPDKSEIEDMTTIEMAKGFWLKANSSCQIDTDISNKESETLSSDMENLKNQVKTIIESATSKGVVGVQVSMRNDSENFTLSSGYSNLESKIELKNSDLFRADSNTKSMVGLISAILHSEKVIDLDKSIDTYLPSNYKDSDLINKLPNTNVITQRDLLTHTSGLPDYISNGFTEYSEKNPNHNWSDYEAIKYIFNEPLVFETGSKYEYSNSGYLLAGIVLDSALGKDYASAFREKVIEPLDLSSTFYQNRSGEEINGNLVNMYIKSDSSKEFKNNSNVNTGWGLSDGGMITNASDLAKYIQALGVLDKKIFNDISAKEYFTPSKHEESYSLGIDRYSEDDGSFTVTHTGSWNHSISKMVYNSGNKYALAYMVNMNVSDENSGDEIDLAFKEMLNALDDLFNNL